MSAVDEIVLDPADRYIHLSSEYSIQNGGTFDCTFPMSAPLATTNDNYCMSMGVRSASIPHSFYNMYGYNWSIQVGNVVRSGSIPRGNYSSVSMATALELSITAAMAIAPAVTGVWTVTYSSTTNYFSVTSTGPDAWAFLYVDGSLYYELGLRALARAATRIVYAQQDGPNFVLDNRVSLLLGADLSGFHSVYVNIIGFNTAGLVSYNQLQQSSVLARIPISQSFGSIETYEPDIIAYHFLPGANLTSLHLVLTGDNGLPLDLNGLDWTMTLSIQFSALRRPEISGEQVLPASTYLEANLFGGRRVI